MAPETMPAGLESEAIRAAFKGDVADTIISLAKNELEVHRQRCKLNKEVFDQRRAAIKTVPKLWVAVLQKSPELSRLLDPKDLDCLDHLEDLHIEFSESDPREFTASFTFDGSNPYFSETTLKKEFKLAPLPDGIKPDSREAYSLDRPLESEEVTISWTSDKHNLVKNRPRQDPNTLEEYDDFASVLGSFFNIFAEKDDPLGVAEALLQTWAECTDIYSGLIAESDDEDDDDGSVSLGDEDEDDQPQRKRSRKA